MREQVVPVQQHVRDRVGTQVVIGLGADQVVPGDGELVGEQQVGVEHREVP